MTERGINILIYEIISQERLTKYLKEAGHDKERALKLYGWNIQLSEAFFPVLGAAEVSLRNIISQQMNRLHGPVWWENPDFIAHIGKGSVKVKAAARDLKKRGKVTSGGMTAELTFGFWVNMLLARHEAVFWRDFRTVFTHLPPQISYGDLYNRCDSVCRFRNRVFHHEPILHRNLTQEYSQIIELIRWLSPAKASWIKQYSRTMTVLRHKP